MRIHLDESIGTIQSGRNINVFGLGTHLTEVGLDRDSRPLRDDHVVLGHEDVTGVGGIESLVGIEAQIGLVNELGGNFQGFFIQDLVRGMEQADAYVTPPDWKMQSFVKMAALEKLRLNRHATHSARRMTAKQESSSRGLIRAPVPWGDVGFVIEEVSR